MTALARLSLANRALVALVTILTIVGGVVATTSLRQELIPSLDLPVASVVTPVPGASPEVVEQQVTAPIETAAGSIEGAIGTTSTSSDGISVVQVELEFGTDSTQVQQELQSAADSVASLPEGADPEVVVGSIDDFPVIQLSVTNGGDEDKLADVLRDDVVPELEAIDDVREVSLVGVRDDVVTVALDTEALVRAGIGPDAVVTALQSSGLVVPAGSVVDGDRALSVQVGERLTDVEQLRALPLLPSAGAAAGGSAAAGGGAGAGAGTEGPAGQPGTGQPGTGQPETGQPGPGQPGTGQPAEGQAPEGQPPADEPDVPGEPAAPAAAPEPVALGDIAEISLAPEDADSLSRTNGEVSLGLSITKTPQGNTVEVSEAVTELLPELESLLGEDGEVTVVFDQAPFIEQSIEDLTVEGSLGLTFAVLVILVFLLSIRLTLVTAVSIPLSLLIAMIGLFAGGYTLNLFTLGALTIAVGRVVDDSIVVIENIKRHLGYGEPKNQAIITGVREVAGAITSSTLATAAVFLPIALVGGQVGELFRPFALTVVLALLASLLVALTIIPVLASWFLRTQEASAGGEPEAVAAATDATASGTTATDATATSEPATSEPATSEPATSEPERTPSRSGKPARRPLLLRSYLPALRFSIARPIITLVLAVAVFAGTLALGTRLQTDFIGDAGQNTLTITQELPAGTSLAATDEAVQGLEEIVTAQDGIESYQVTIGSGSAVETAFGGAGGTSSAQYAVTTDVEADTPAIVEELRSAVDSADGLGEVAVSEGQAGFGSADIEVLVQADPDGDLAEAARLVTEAVSEVEGTSQVTSNLADELPTVQVDVDRDAAAGLGLTEATVAQTVAAALRGTPVGEITTNGATASVVLETGEAPASVEELAALPLTTVAGPVPLSDVAEVAEVTVPVSITREDQARSATVSATPTGDDLGALTADLQAAIDDVELPDGTTAEVGGVSAEQQEAFADLGLALLAAIAIVYLVMVATFRSLVQPLILLVSVPFAATGAIGLLLLTGVALDVTGLIGSLLLVGIVVTNAIVLIDLINQYRQRGMGIDESVVEGATHRLRPIVMTALATIFALSPLALAVTGGSAFISQPLGIVVIGGLVSSTVLTLVLVPALYVLVERAGERLRRRRERRRARRAEQRQRAQLATTA